jgi:Uma2 family endonuclease
MPMPGQNGKYTYKDYLGWQDGKRWEIIGGEAYAMTPAPGTTHQGISMTLSGIFFAALKDKPCVPFAAPCDVVLSDSDVVQPDLLVVCDPAKITEKCVTGAPDLIIEILSPSSAAHDLRDKRFLYELHGVREYLIIDPMGQLAHRYLLGENGKYRTNEVFDSQQELPLLSLPGVSLPLWTVFGVPKKEPARKPTGDAGAQPA